MREKSHIGRSVIRTRRWSRIALAGSVATVCTALFAASGSGVSAAAIAKAPSAKGALVYNIEPLVFTYNTALDKGIFQEAAASGVRLRTVFSNDEPTTMDSQIHEAIALHAKAIVIQPEDSTAAVVPIKAAIAAGICVVGVTVPIGSKPGLYPGTYAYVGNNSVQSGEIIGQALAKAIGYHGDVAILLGLVSNGTSYARYLGLKAAFGRYRGIHIVAFEQTSFDVGTARSEALALISKYGSALKALYVDTNPAAAVVVQAINGTALKGKIAIGSIGGEGAYDRFIKAGDATVDIAEDPVTQGYFALKYAVDCIEHKKSPGWVTADYLVTHYTAFGKKYGFVITKQNVGFFRPQW